MPQQDSSQNPHRERLRAVLKPPAVPNPGPAPAGPTTAADGAESSQASRPSRDVAAGPVGSQPSSRFCSRSVWWQWTTWPRGVMTDSARPPAPDMFVASGQELDGRLGAAGGLSATRWRRGSPRWSAVDGGSLRRRRTPRDTHGSTWTRSCARSGADELAVAGYIGRSPRSPRCPRQLACHEIIAAAPVSSQPRPGRGRKASDAVEAAWQALG